MVGLVLVSHSATLAMGAAEVAGQMAGPDVVIAAAGGSADGGLGTDEGAVEAAVDRAQSGDGVVVIGDLGSAILTVRSVLEETGDDVRLADAPLVEGAIQAAVTASADRPLDEVLQAAEAARGATKL